MKKRFVKVALLSLAACASTGAFVACSDDDWKSPVENVETSVEGINKTIGQLDEQIKALDTKIAESKAAADAAAQAAADAMAAAQAADAKAEDAKKYAEEAAQKYAEEAAQRAIQTAAEQLKAEIEAVKALIQANADAIASNKEVIDGNSEAIKENAGKIEGNTKAIEDLLNALNEYKGENDSKIQEILDKLDAVGVDIENLGAELGDKIAGLNAALEVLEGKCEALGLDITKLDEALRAEIGTLSETLAAQIASETAAREAGDAELKKMIEELTKRIDALDLATNLEEFSKFVASAQTQIDALNAFKEKMETDFAALKGKVDGIEAIVNSNTAAIDELTGKLNETAEKAAKNAADILAQAALIADNTERIGKLETGLSELQQKFEELVGENGDIAALKAFKEQASKDIADINGNIDEINERLNALAPLLNTMIFDQLRGLVFMPEAYFGGIESALSYHMDYYSMTDIKNTPNTYTYDNTNTIFKVSNYNIWNKEVAKDAKLLAYEAPTIVSYHMNPKSAVVSFADLSIVSNDAEILTRTSEAMIALDPTFNENTGLKVENGVLSVAIKGNAPVYDANKTSEKMPVFALQAEIAGNQVDEETGKPIINNITSDYAMFVKMNVIPEAILYNQNKYVAQYGAAAMRSFTEVQPNKTINKTLDNLTATTVAWNGNVNLLELLKISYTDQQRYTNSDWLSSEEWEKYGLTMKFQLIDYTIGDNKVSESSWAVIDPATGVLTACVNNDASKQSPDALGHMPLVYVTVSHENDLILDGFIKVKIVPTEDYYVTDAITYSNIDFTCDQEMLNQPENVLPLEMMLKVTGLSQDVFIANYKPDTKTVTGSAGGNDEAEIFIQYKKDETNNHWVPLSVDEEVGMVVPNLAMNNENYFYDLGWVFLDADGKQIAYQKPDHTATVYVCFEATSDSYSDVYIPLNITVNEKATLSVGKKVEARWFRENDNTALLNVPQPTDNQTVTTINTDLDQLWTNDLPTFTQVSGYPEDAEVEGYKYYFAASNNRTYEGVTYKVTNAQNPNLIDNKKASNADMGDLALLTSKGLASEYNNNQLYANGVLIATLNQETGTINYETTPDALKYLNMFNSMGGLNRPDAKLEAIIGVVPYSLCEIAYKLTNPVFNVAFLRPINVDPNKGYVFSDAEANGSPINIYGMLAFSDWRNVSFLNNEWLFGYYNVKQIYPVLDEMTTNIATINSDPNNFAPASQSVKKAFSYSFEGNAPTMNYTGINNENSNYAVISNLTSGLGTITYDNTDLNVKEYKVRIPFVVKYELGEFKTSVECTIKTTLGN